MNNKPAEQVRNFSIAGHAGHGKTARSDLILFKSGAVPRLGSVDQKTSVADCRPEEEEKGCSLYASPMTCEWNDTRLFFIDTPGNTDSFGDTIAALNICDMDLVVVDGGVEIGTTRPLTQGRGSFDMEFARYEQVPANVAKDIQDKAVKDAEDE